MKSLYNKYYNAYTGACKKARLITLKMPEQCIIKSYDISLLRYAPFMLHELIHYNDYIL